MIIYKLSAMDILSNQKIEFNLISFQRWKDNKNQKYKNNLSDQPLGIKIASKIEIKMLSKH